MPTEQINTPANGRPKNGRRRRRSALFVVGRVVLGLLLFIAVLLPVLWYLVPPYLVNKAQSWYAEQGEGYELTIDRWDLSFWSGRLELSGLVFNHPGKQGDRSELGTLVLDLDTGRVVHGVVAISNFDLDGLHARAVRTSKGIEALGLEFPASTGTDDAAANDGNVEQTLLEQLAALPAVELDSLHFTDIQLGWQQPKGSKNNLPRRAQVAIDDLVLSDINTHSPDLINFSTRMRVQSLELEQPSPLRLLRPLTLVTHGKVEEWADNKARRLRTDIELKGLDVLYKQQAHIQLGSARLAGVNATLKDQSAGLLLLEDLLVGERIITAPTSAGPAVVANETTTDVTRGQVAVPEQPAVAPLQGTDIHVAPEASKLPVQPKVDSGSPKGNTLETTLLSVSRYQVQRIEFSKHRLKTALHELQGVEVSTGSQDGYLIGATWLGPILAPAADAAQAAPATEAATATEPATGTAEDASVADTSAKAAGAAEDKAQPLPFEMDIAGIRMTGILVHWQQAGLEVGLAMGNNRIGAINSESVDPIELEGGMELRKLNVGAPLAPSSVHLQQPVTLIWKGDVRDWRRQPELNGEFSAQGLSMLVDDYIPLLADQIRLSGIRATAKLQEISSLVISGASIREQPAAGSDSLVGNTLLSVEEYKVPSIYFDGQMLTTGVNEIAAAQIRMQRDANGNIRFIPQRPNGQVVTSGKETTAENSDMLQFRIAGIQQQEDKPSLLFWHDQAIKPEVRTNVTVDVLNVGVITNATLFANKRGDVQRAEFTAQLSLDEYNKNRFTGEIGLVGGDVDGHLGINVTQLNLVPLSPYVIDSIGYRVRKGMLRVNGDIDFDRGKMNGKTTLRLKNSEFEPADERIIQNVSQQLSMPVETALSLLKDKNNNLKMDLPISGSLDNPNVGINDILAQLSQTAVKTAAMYYLKQLLQPYTTVISVAQYAGEKLLAIRLDPLQFESGKAELTDEHRQYLGKVAEMMDARINLELQVCPFASDAEVKSLGDKWGALADQRGRLIKAELAGFKDQRGNSLSGRVTLCGAQKGGKPRVELGL